jgi:hypothetical protein
MKFQLELHPTTLEAKMESVKMLEKPRFAEFLSAEITHGHCGVMRFGLTVEMAALS